MSHPPAPSTAPGVNLKPCACPSPQSDALQNSTPFSAIHLNPIPQHSPPNLAPAQNFMRRPVNPAPPAFVPHHHLEVHTWNIPRGCSKPLAGWFEDPSMFRDRTGEEWSVEPSEMSACAGDGGEDVR